MRNVWTIAYHTQLKMLRNPSLTLIMFIMPMLLIYILGSALADQFAQKDQLIPSVRLAIASDNSQTLKRQFQAYLDSLPSKASIELSNADSTNQLENLIVSKKVDLGLFVPTNDPQWKIMNGSDPIKNITGQTIIENFNNHRIRAEIELQNLGVKPLVISQSKENIVEVTKLYLNEKKSTAMQYYSAVNIVMYILYAGMMTALSFIRERENFTLSRLNSLPIPNRHIIFGVILGNGIFAIMEVLLLIAGTSFIYGVNWGHQMIGLFLILALSIIISLALGTLVALNVKTIKASAAIFQALIITMTFVSGGFVANLDQFKWFAILEKYTINYWAVQGLLRSMMNNGLTEIVSYISILGTLGALLLLLLWFSYRKVGYYE